MSSKALTPAAVSLPAIRLDAERFPRLKDIPEATAVTQIAKVVSDAFLYRGQAAEPANVKFIASALREELLADTTYGLPFITVEEIRRAVREAVLAKDDLFGVNVSSLYKVLLAYAKGAGRLADIEAGKILKAEKAAAEKSDPRLDALIDKYSTTLLSKR